jgi:surfeit locus 1 family protein
MFRHISSQLMKLRPAGQCVLRGPSPVKAATPTLIRQAFVHHYKVPRKPDRKNFKEMGYLLLTIPAITFGLGVWQVKRRKWKLGLIEEMEARTQAPPVSLPYDPEEIEKLEFRKVTVKGRFDHSKEVYITPVSKVEDESKKQALITAAEAGVGAFVVTPFHLSDRNWTILINRGFVPRKRVNPSTRPDGQIEGEVELTGLLRLTEKRQQFQPKTGSGPGQWLRRDVIGIAQYLDTAPVFLDADLASTVEGGPIGGQTRINLRNEHLSYIITWFSLSSITTFMWYQRYWRGVM